MPRFSFQRRLRTPSSEQFNVFDANSEISQNAVGQMDVHYVSAEHIEATIALFDEQEAEDIEELLATLNDDILNLSQSPDTVARAVVFFGQEFSVYEIGGNDFDDGEEDDVDESDRTQIV